MLMRRRRRKIRRKRRRNRRRKRRRKRRKSRSQFLPSYFPDELLRSMAQVKRILSAKWGGEGSGRQDQLTQEAERLEGQAKSEPFLPFLVLLTNLTFAENRVSGDTTGYVNKMIVKYS
jgi:hypothetical protein